MAEQKDVQEPVKDPQSYAEYYRQGWAFHASGKHDAAEENLRRAIELEPNSVDAHFLLGLILKAQERGREAILVFRRVIELIESDEVENNVRSGMVRRLALGHVNQLEKGDWNLEDEIWQRTNSTTKDA